jgi:hypothetical protein
MAVLGFAAHGASGQFIGGQQSHANTKTEAVQYLFPEQVTLPAGKASPVMLHFRIASGLHVNSNKPHDEFLIPTVFSIPDGSGVKLAAAVYPQGTDITLPADPKTKLNVYTGEFAIETKLVAAAGNHLVQAKLRYQACDNSQCMPPKTITVPVSVTGK